MAKYLKQNQQNPPPPQHLKQHLKQTQDEHSHFLKVAMPLQPKNYCLQVQCCNELN